MSKELSFVSSNLTMSKIIVLEQINKKYLFRAFAFLSNSPHFHFDVIWVILIPGSSMMSKKYSSSHNT